MADIYDKLNSLNQSDYYPLHMPGHKRNWPSVQAEEALAESAGIDITEIDDFDNLHDASGFLKNAQDRANRLYGAEETYFLINGSTCGVLSAVSAVLDEGDIIIADRASHKSFYHAVYLQRGKLSLMQTELDAVYGYPYPATVGNVERQILGCGEDQKPAAIFITSPTYEGIPADVRGIAELAHRHGIPLIVDEAHGAHFGVVQELPESAVAQGADLVIHSVHKTLPSLTQTALLHVQGKLVSRERLHRFLHIYQSSSPSYVLMASIDSSMQYMKEHGEEWFANLQAYREYLQRETANCRVITILPVEQIPDPCKVLIACTNGAVTGQEIYAELREKYQLQCEMAGETYALGIITGSDTWEGIKRLAHAVVMIDAEIRERIEQQSDNKKYQSKALQNDLRPNSGPEVIDVNELDLDKDVKDEKKLVLSRVSETDGVKGLKEKENLRPMIPEKKYEFARCWDQDSTKVLLEDAAGHVSATFVNFYPPGTPILLPGEVYSTEIIAVLQNAVLQKRNLQGVVENAGKYYVEVLVSKTVE